MLDGKPFLPAAELRRSFCGALAGGLPCGGLRR
jgi:hypothetical protein